MKDNEDEPADVRSDNPVESEVNKGQTDEPAQENVTLTKKSNVKNETETKKKSDEDCCETKKKIMTKKEPKRRTINVFEKECKPPKSNPVPRHCVSKKEHLDILATPKQICPSPTLQKTVVRKLAPVSPRILQLAKPRRQYILRTIQERSDVLPSEILQNLIQMIETESSLSPEQTAQIYRTKKKPSMKKRKKKKKGVLKCKSKEDKRAKKCKRRESGDQSDFNPEAVCCQYQMAEKFVKSILDWQCQIPKEEFRDIAEVILRRLSLTLEYTPADNGDRRSQQMRFLADVVSCWITGVLIEVAENYEESEEERKRRQQEEEETDEDEDEDTWSESPDEDDDDDDSQGTGKKGKQVHKMRRRRKGDGEDAEDDEEPEDDFILKLDEEEEPEEDFTLKLDEEEEPEEDFTLKLDEEEEPEEDFTLKLEDEEEPEEDFTLKLEDEEEPEEDFTLKLEDEEEPEEDFKLKLEEEEPEEEPEEDFTLKLEDEEEPEEDFTLQLEDEEEPEEDITLKLDEEEDMPEEGEDIQHQLQEEPKSDLPFITFPQIFNTIYKAMEAEKENDGKDPVVNRVHRAVYEKCEKAVKLENPDLLTNNVKDVIDVMAGKIAVWLTEVLSESQVDLLKKSPPEVESCEVRDWSKWLNQTTKTARNWSVWLQSLIKEAQKMQEEKVTRGEWEDWTKKFDTNAMLWRRFHLDTVHQAHHNNMMMKDREVVKTRGKMLPEQEMEITDYDL